MKMGRLLFFSGICLVFIGTSSAQAPPGPIQPPPGAIQPPSASPPLEKKPQAKPRNNILGDWKLNHDESDDPRDKLQQARENSGANNGGGNRGGSAGPRIGFPGGGIGGGGMGGGRPRQSQSDDTDTLQEKINPPLQMNF